MAVYFYLNILFVKYSNKMEAEIVYISACWRERVLGFFFKILVKFICPWAELSSLSTFLIILNTPEFKLDSTWADKCHYWMSLFDQKGQGKGHKVENDWNLDCDWTITPFFLAVSDKGVIFLGYKGQSISECLFDTLNFPKNQRKIWQISALEYK